MRITETHIAQLAITMRPTRAANGNPGVVPPWLAAPAVPAGPQLETVVPPWLTDPVKPHQARMGVEVMLPLPITDPDVPRIMATARPEVILPMPGPTPPHDQPHIW